VGWARGWFRALRSVAALAFERREAGFQRVNLVGGLDGHVLDRVEFFAADEIEPAEGFAEAFARSVAGFAAHAGNSARRAVHQLGEIGEEGVFALHGR